MDECDSVGNNLVVGGSKEEGDGLGNGINSRWGGQ